MKKIRWIALGVLVCILAAVPGHCAFQDVDPGAYYAAAVDWAVEKQVTDGVSDTLFAPNAPCTRAQVVGFLWKLAGRPSSSAEVRFADVPVGSWFYEPVRWAVEQGVTNGVTDALFAPNRSCTRAEGAAFLHRYCGGESVSGAVPFNDVSRSSWFHSAVLWGVENGVVNGVSPTAYQPQGMFTRAHIVTMLWRLETAAAPERVTGVYLGVQGYGAVSDKDAMVHRFWYGGAEHTARIPSEQGAYTLQNLLEEGGVYTLLFRDGVLLDAAPAETACLTGVPSLPVYAIEKAAGGASVRTAQALPGQYAAVGADAVYLSPEPIAYTPPVQGTPGLKTLRNFLRTALEPTGTTLYVYGGGWNWQDTAGSKESASIGVAESWVRFFREQDGAYNYKNTDPAHSYYPYQGWNQYYYAGLDCSGFVGWAVYNTIETASGTQDYVTPAKTQAKRIAETGLGTCSDSLGALLPGDVVSMSGHVWICLGTCADGSVLILHSTPGTGRGGSGGGVQLSAIGGSTSCEAYRLAERYMSRYWPEWCARYETYLCSPGTYFQCTGHFTWNSALDPDGCRSMTPAALLKNLFGE